MSLAGIAIPLIAETNVETWWQCFPKRFFVVDAKKIIVNRLLLVVLSFAGALAVMEVVLRVVPRTPEPDPMGDRSRFFYAPDDGRKHAWSHKSANEIRIAVVGDSFTEGVGVPFDYRYANCLERLLNMRTGLPNVEVRVFSLCGTSTFQQIGLLEEALKWKANIVILGICLNDMEDWAAPKELMRWRSTLLPRVPTHWLAGVFRFSRALSWIYTTTQQAEAHWGELLYYRRLYNSSYKGVRRFRESIEIMNIKCREANVVFLPMIFPLLSEKFQKGCYPFEYAHEAIHSRCEELNIKYLDLLPAFRGASPDRMQVIPGFDPHPNEIAHRMAAETLLLYLLDQGVIPKEYKPLECPSQMVLRTRWMQTIQRMEYPLSMGTN